MTASASIAGKKLRWGILATGEIARAFAEGMVTSRTGELVAVGSRSQASADEFGDRYSVPHRHGSYEALLADVDVQAVYISTPHPLHREWAIRAAAAKKHILCEKPIALNFREATEIIAAAQANDVFLMEAFMYRCHPQTHKLVELLKQKAIGDVRMIQATFSFRSPFNPAGRLWSNELGGGGIMDVGCYPVSMCRLVAGVATGLDCPAEPQEVAGTGRLNETTGVDEVAVGTLKFPGGIVATIATGVVVEQENVVRIYGTEGRIVIPNPWTPARDGGTATMQVHRDGESRPQEITVQTPQQIYGLEADCVAAHLAQRQAAFPAMNWNDTLGNIRALDRWRQAVGVAYPADEAGTIV